MKKVEYSSREREVLKIVRTSGEVTTKDLVEKVFGDDRPFYARQSIVSTLSILSRKVEARKEKFRLHRSERKGSHPMRVWIEEGAR